MYSYNKFYELQIIFCYIYFKNKSNVKKIRRIDIWTSLQITHFVTNVIKYFIRFLSSHPTIFSQNQVFHK